MIRLLILARKPLFTWRSGKLTSSLESLAGGGAMTVNVKRRALVLAAAAGALATGSTRAQAWPARPIKIVCPLPPGGLTDLYSRAIGEHMQATLGQPVLIENRPGAGGIIGCEAVAKSPPDGYTFLVTIQTSLVQAQVLYKKLPYNPETD